MWRGLGLGVSRPKVFSFLIKPRRSENPTHVKSQILPNSHSLKSKFTETEKRKVQNPAIAEIPKHPKTWKT